MCLNHQGCGFSHDKTNMEILKQCFLNNGHIKELTEVSGRILNLHVKLLMLLVLVLKNPTT